MYLGFFYDLPFYKEYEEGVLNTFFLSFVSFTTLCLLFFIDKSNRLNTQLVTLIISFEFFALLGSNHKMILVNAIKTYFMSNPTKPTNVVCFYFKTN